MSDDEAPFSVTATQGDDRFVLTVTGELDAATTVDLESAIQDADPSVPGLEVDLTGVSFIDSSGLRTLVMARQSAEESGRRFSISGSSKAVDRLLELTGLETLRD